MSLESKIETLTEAVNKLTIAFSGATSAKPVTNSPVTETKSVDIETDTDTIEEDKPSKVKRTVAKTKDSKAKTEVKAKRQPDATEDEEGNANITSDECQALAKKRVAEGLDRSEIKAKIKEFGADIISGLDQEGLNAFYDYLNGNGKGNEDEEL